MRVFVTGGTGLIGSRLVRRLRERGDHGVLLTRRPDAAPQRVSDCTIVEGDPMQAAAWMDSEAEGDAAINLPSENIFARPWHHEFKTLLRDSRVKSTENVVRALATRPRTAAGNAKVLVNASAIGYHGPTGDEELTEDSPPGNDTLARVCIEWEQAARGAEAHGVRVAMVRVGVVLDNEGGALKQMLTPFKLFVGGKVGSGKQ